MKSNVDYVIHHDRLLGRRMIRDLDLSLLRAFLAVVEAGSVTAAARNLNRTQAAVSMQIRRLEDLLAKPLFEREHKRLSLAPAGEQLLGEAQRLVALNDEIMERMTEPAFEGEVRLGMPVDLIPTYAPPILRRFNANHPRVRVSLNTHNSHELMADLDQSAVDLALTTDLAGEPPRACETLHIDKLVWFGAPGGNAHRRTPLPLSIGSRTCRFRPVVIEALRSVGRDWRFVLEVANQDAVNAMVEAGISVAALMRETVPRGLEILDPAAGLPELPKFAINLHMPRRNASATAEELARHIRAEFASRSALQLQDADLETRPGRRPTPRLSNAAKRATSGWTKRRA
jgi:DNA-binding transcriptional LysR family regulator